MTYGKTVLFCCSKGMELLDLCRSRSEKGCGYGRKRAYDDPREFDSSKRGSSKHEGKLNLISVITTEQIYGENSWTWSDPICLGPYTSAVRMLEAGSTLFVHITKCLAISKGAYKAWAEKASCHIFNEDAGSLVDA